MALDMKTRQKVIREIAPRYRAASKRERGRLLDELSECLGGDRSSLARALRRESSLHGWGGSRTRSGRKPVYGTTTLDPLRRIWAILSFPCGRRLVSQMGELLDVLERCGEMRVSSEVRSVLLAMSSSTADRLLAPDRKKMSLQGRSRTKPGTRLRAGIRVRTFADWNETVPGFTEMDLVSHEGGDGRGDFCYTLTVTDIATGWTECRALRNRAQQWTFEGLKRLRRRLPFPLLGVDSDNGSEFINNQMVRYCQQERLTFTRSRPYRKNDNCFVEQKNYTVVRQMVGYRRYDTESAQDLLNRLYDRHRLYANYFLPQMKLVEKHREGSHVTRRYDDPQTPYQRLLQSPHVAGSIKESLRQEYATLNPAALRRELSEMQAELAHVALMSDEQNE